MVERVSLFGMFGASLGAVKNCGYEYEVMSVDQDSYSSRMSLFGDLPTRSMLWVVKSFPRMPYFIEAFLLYSSVAIIFCLAREQRRAIRANLRHIHQDLSVVESYWGAYCVLKNFGWAYIDSMRAKFGQKSITWELEGEEVFQEIRDSKKAAILFTTHTGNYDLAACLFASSFGRTLHTVRVPERTESLQKLRKKEFEEQMDKYPFFKVHYNTSDNLLGIELAKLLSDGELIALQCDRVFGDVVELELPVEETEWSLRVPKGPMTLACFAKCPCYPLYVVRDRHRHYRVIFEPALELEMNPNQRRAKELDYAKPWLQRLRRFLRCHSHEWFVFENAFTKKK